MKKLLLPFFCMSCVSAISAQNIPEDADTLSIGLKEVKVMASYGHDKGTGLGLAICKQIVLRFGGNIWIDPEYTEGARFVFSHPIVP